MLVLVILVLSIGVEANKNIQVVQTILPYYQLMTPKWIHKYSTITGPHALYPQYFEILPTTGANWQRALQVQLVPPGILASTDDITVTITVAMNTVLANSIDHDPSFGISDGTSFIGLHQTDKTNYHNLSPCRHIEGNKNGIFLKNVIAPNGPTVSSRAFTSEAKMQIRPTEKWGSCHTENDGGYTNIVNYERQL
ncbi:uncharacterized protein [Dysidea avara]|uniref:uncharacterized protein isoform X2 n=1 Tax=Dysidea avara TaxID=196820 RepID=UPI00333168DC